MTEPVASIVPITTVYPYKIQNVYGAPDGGKKITDTTYSVITYDLDGQLKKSTNIHTIDYLV